MVSNSNAAAWVREMRLLEAEGDRPLAHNCARRLADFATRRFDPNSDASWDTLDKLWRAAMLTREAKQ